MIYLLLLLRVDRIEGWQSCQRSGRNQWPRQKGSPTNCIFIPPMALGRLVLPSLAWKKENFHSREAIPHSELSPNTISVTDAEPGSTLGIPQLEELSVPPCTATKNGLIPSFPAQISRWDPCPKEPTALKAEQAGALYSCLFLFIPAPAPGFAGSALSSLSQSSYL